MREILFFVLLAGCGSPPKVSEKPMKVAPPEFQAVVAYSPRRATELVDGILSSPNIQNCLKAEPEAQRSDFNATLEGYLDYKGVMDSVNLAGPAGLRACLSHELGRLPFGRGRAGPFKMQLMQKKPLLPDLPS